MSSQLSDAVLAAYGRQTCLRDMVEYRVSKIREMLLGVNGAIFDKTIRFFAEKRGLIMTRAEALARAQDKQRHKKMWYSRERQSIEEKMHFYQEADVYPFRQPFLKRHGGFRWYRRLVGHRSTPAILEYGCGSAILTEYLLAKYPEATYTVADIPSLTLEFVTWKQAMYGMAYKILTIGVGKQGIPLSENYDLIICQDVLEHTPNPIDIVSAFIEHLAPEGVLVIDFMNAPDGENLVEAAEQRDAVKRLLKNKLVPIKAIDEPHGYDGLYLKST